MSNMQSLLRTKLAMLADDFANEVVQAIRSASLEELVLESHGVMPPTARKPRNGRISAGAIAKIATNGHTNGVATKAARIALGRLPRRSPEEIAKQVAAVASLLKKGPMRSEEIRAAGNFDKRELPRILQTGVKSKTLKAKGVKRATQYSVA